MWAASCGRHKVIKDYTAVVYGLVMKSIKTPRWPHSVVVVVVPLSQNTRVLFNIRVVGGSAFYSYLSPQDGRPLYHPAVDRWGRTNTHKSYTQVISCELLWSQQAVVEWFSFYDTLYFSPQENILLFTALYVFKTVVTSCLPPGECSWSGQLLWRGKIILLSSTTVVVCGFRGI